MFQGKKISLYISGGIASYKIADLARRLIKAGAEVRVAMTEAATAFISPLTLQVLTKHAVMVDVLDEPDAGSVVHIDFAQWGDYAILAPATANTMAKLAAGLADNFVSTALLAAPGPIFIVPAMNDKMLAHPATQRNIETLRQDGHYVMETEEGFLAEGYIGKGRLPDQVKIMADLADWIRNQEDLPLSGQSILVSAGGTVERIDPVRYISNDSSGRMGHAIAEAAYRLGADVTLVTASSLPTDPKIHRIQVESAQDMYKALDQRFADCQALVMAAAVSDYRPVQESDQKIKKTSRDGGLSLELKENPDIIKNLGAKKAKQVLVGFAAETQHLEDYAQKKLQEKNLDMIVANDVSQPGSGFNVSTNEVLMIKADGETIAVPQRTKEEVGSLIMQEVIKIMEEKNA